jgi:hypothetical protein
MIARYPGRCSRTGAPIRPGDTIVYVGKGRAYLSDLLPDVDPDLALAESIDPDLALAESVDPELAQSDPEAAAAAGRYLRQSMARSVSSLWRGADGREFYRNKRGRCEDAPCCGCCSA